MWGRSKIIVLLLLLCGLSGCDNTRGFEIEISDHLGGQHILSKPAEKKLLVLFWTGVGCPIAQQTLPEMKRIAADFEKRGVQFLYVDGNPGDRVEEICSEAEEFEIERPILLDQDQRLTSHFQVLRTCEAIVVDWKGDTLYRGAVDDSLEYGTRKPARNFYLRDALELGLTRGESSPKTAVKGCLIEEADGQG